MRRKAGPQPHQSETAQAPALSSSASRAYWSAAVGQPHRQGYGRSRATGRRRAARGERWWLHRPPTEEIVGGAPRHRQAAGRKGQVCGPYLLETSSTDKTTRDVNPYVAAVRLEGRWLDRVLDSGQPSFGQERGECLTLRFYVRPVIDGRQDTCQLTLRISTSGEPATTSLSPLAPWLSYINDEIPATVRRLTDAATPPRTRIRRCQTTADRLPGVAKCR
jgi:hypothetical protein